MKLEHKNSICTIWGLQGFSLRQTMESGQAFRFVPQGQGYLGVVQGRPIYLEQQGDSLLLSPTTKEEVQSLWVPYLDLTRDYAAIRQNFQDDPVMVAAMDFGSGIRILRQEPWETLVTFLMSQCNNIPRIKSILQTLCQLFGSSLSYEGQTLYTFPSPETIAALTLEDLAPLRCGYRGKYLLACAKLVASGQFDLDALYPLPMAEARKQLLSLPGVGIKVADCVLLFGYGKLDAFPVDVWMDRAIGALYRKEDFHPSRFGAYCGIAQQYLFYYARENQIGKPTKGKAS